MKQYLKIKELLDTGLAISYKRLSIEKILYKGEFFIQVDCDRFDLIYSKLYSLNNKHFAIAKFTSLMTRYMASELKNGD